MNNYEVTITISVNGDSLAEAKAAALDYLHQMDDIRDSEIKPEGDDEREARRQGRELPADWEAENDH